MSIQKRMRCLLRKSCMIMKSQRQFHPGGRGGNNMVDWKLFIGLLHIFWLTYVGVGGESDGAALLVVFPYKYGQGEQFVVDPVKEFKDFSEAPSHYGERHPAPPDAYAKEPACSWNDNETISGLCLMDYRYPQFAVEKALLLHYEAVTELYKDVLVAANNSANYLTKNGTEKYICASNVTYAHPMRAKNIRGKWRVIVQRVRVHYDTLTQSVRVEQCHREGDQKCPLTAEDATAQSKCIQKETYQRLLVYDPYDYHLPFKMDTFKIPTSCACFVPFVANPEDEDDSSVVSFPLALGRPQGLAFVNGDAPPTGLAQALASDPRPPFAQPVSRPGATGAATGAATADSSGRLSDSGLGYSADDIAVGESERVETGREILSTASQRLSIEEIGSSEDANNDGDDFEEAEYEDFDIARIDKNVLENEYYYYEDDENVDFSPAEFDETLALAAVLTEADLVQMH